MVSYKITHTAHAARWLQDNRDQVKNFQKADFKVYYVILYVVFVLFSSSCSGICCYILVATVESAHGNGVFVWDEERYQPASGRQIADTSFSTTHHTACRVSSSSRTARQHADTPCDLSPPSLHVDVQTYREDDETDYHQINNSETLSMRGAESVETASVEAESVEAAPEEAASVDAVAEDEVYGNHESADAESIISVYTLD